MLTGLDDCRNQLANGTTGLAEDAGIPLKEGAQCGKGDGKACAIAGVKVALLLAPGVVNKIGGKLLDAVGLRVADAGLEGGDLAGARAAGTACSFTASTQVLMADGSAKPIASIKVGDQIANALPGDTKTSTHTVTAIHVTDTDRDFVDLTIATPAGPKKITTTGNHRFYDASTHTWTGAAALKLGDQLDTPGEGRATILEVHRYTAAQRMYNLTIDGVHTYYVVAGTTPVLVHNVCDLADIAANHRATANGGLGVSASKNIAVMRSEIDGQALGTTIATSSRHVNPGEVSRPATRQFSPPNPSRAFDSEVFLFENIARGLNPGSTGTIDLFLGKNRLPWL